MRVLTECFHLQYKTLVNGIQDMSQKNNRMALIRFVGGNLRVYQATESSCFIAARVTGAHETLFNL